jgi:hypothetical protein
MRRVFIVGGGKFGNKALEQIRLRWKTAQIWLVDSRPELLGENKNRRTSLIRVIGDGPRFLSDYKSEMRDDDWIIPAVPCHLAFEWLRLNLKTKAAIQSLTPPGTLGRGLPFRKRIGKNLYLSDADFVCPDNCPAPVRYCFKTKKRRPAPLWKRLATHQGLKGTLLVLESRQLAPGLGGFPYKDLRKLLQKALETSSPFYVATACRCHGVVSGLTRQ